MDPTMGQPLETWTVAVEADTSGLEDGLKSAAGLGRQFASAIGTAFEGIALKGKSLGDVFKSLALRLSDLVLKAAMKPLEQGLGNLFSGMLGGMGFAKGGVFQQSMPVPFAAGGVIQSPISFPMRGGRFGIAGEAGPEAIMPLSRGADGRLGVAVRGGGGGGPNITFNVATPDADSFRRSETQVGAMLARAVALGQRNL